MGEGEWGKGSEGGGGSEIGFREDVIINLEFMYNF